MVFSGKTKSQISKVSTPGGESILDAPQLLVLPDGTTVVVFTTGDVVAHGNTYCSHLHNIVKGDISKNYILLSANGNSVSPLLVDMNNDGTDDIVTANGPHISVYDGRTFNKLWNASVSLTITDVLMHTFISPTPAYFNDDLIPDILVTQLAGSDILTVYFTQISVLDGKTGQLLLERPIIGSGAVDSPAITLTNSGIGNDYFLFWQSVCLGYESNKDAYHVFRENTNVREQSRTDFCRVRFNSTTEMRLYALSQHIEPPGTLLYSTELRWDFEHNITGKVEEAQTFIEANSPSIPPLLNNYRRKGLAPPIYHRNGNHKSRLQFSSQETNPLSYDKEQQPNYPYYQDRTGTIQGQWPPVAVPQPQDLSNYNAENYRENANFNNQRLLSPLLGSLSEMGQEYDASYNEDNEELLGGPLPSDRDRDERESYQEINDRLQNKKLGQNNKNLDKGTTNSNINNNQNTKQQNIVKRSANEKNKKLSVPRVTAAASLAPTIGENTNGIDVIFATHWVSASQHEMVLLSDDDLMCIKNRMEQSERVKFQEEELRLESTIDCLTERSVVINSNSQNTLRLDKGQLTVYRTRLHCNCTHINPKTEVCSQPLSLQRQSWPNWGGNSYYKIRQP